MTPKMASHKRPVRPALVARTWAASAAPGAGREVRARCGRVPDGQHEHRVARSDGVEGDRVVEGTSEARRASFGRSASKRRIIGSRMRPRRWGRGRAATAGHLDERVARPVQVASVLEEEDVRHDPQGEKEEVGPAVFEGPLQPRPDRGRRLDAVGGIFVDGHPAGAALLDRRGDPGMAIERGVELLEREPPIVRAIGVAQHRGARRGGPRPPRGRTLRPLRSPAQSSDGELRAVDLAVAVEVVDSETQTAACRSGRRRRGASLRRETRPHRCSRRRRRRGRTRSAGRGLRCGYAGNARWLARPCGDRRLTDREGRPPATGRSSSSTGCNRSTGSSSPATALAAQRASELSQLARPHGRKPPYPPPSVRPWCQPNALPSRSGLDHRLEGAWNAEPFDHGLGHLASYRLGPRRALPSTLSDIVRSVIRVAS